jgi:hypothetical protein
LAARRIFVHFLPLNGLFWDIFESAFSKLASGLPPLKKEKLVEHVEVKPSLDNLR